MRGGGVIGLLALGFVGIILADALMHPRGVRALGSTVNSSLKTTTNAMLGYPTK